MHLKLDWAVKFMECAKQDSHLQLDFLIAALILAALPIDYYSSQFI